MNLSETMRNVNNENIMKKLKSFIYEIITIYKFEVKEIQDTNKVTNIEKRRTIKETKIVLKVQNLIVTLLAGKMNFNGKRCMDIK